MAGTATAEPTTALPHPARAVRDGLPPGPRLPAPIQTFGLVARPVPFFERLRSRYGDTFTLRILRAGQMVFISDPPSLKRLFGADRRNTIAPGRNVILRPILGDQSLLLQEGDEHLRRRKLMLPPFHGERMRAYETVMAQATDREIDSWPVGTEFRLHPSMQSITLEVILSAVFGVEEGTRRNALRTNLIGILATTRSPAAIGLSIDRMRRLPRYRRVTEMLAQADRILFDEIEARRADPNLDDARGHPLDARRGPLRGRLRDVRCRASRPADDPPDGGPRDHRDGARVGVRPAVPRSGEADAAARGGGRRRGHGYLDAVIKETLRIRPVVPFVGRELREEAELGGYALPAGTIVMPAIYLAHTRSDVYERPL